MTLRVVRRLRMIMLPTAHSHSRRLGRDPLLARDPAFAELLDDASFKAQVTRMTALISIERAKPNMAPLP